MRRSQLLRIAESGVAALVVAATLVTVIGSSNPALASSPPDFGRPTSTSWPASGCASMGTDSVVTQSFSGEIHGCIRVPNVDKPGVVVSLQAYISQTAEKFAGTPSPISSGITADGVFRLSVAPTTVTPGEEINLIGRYPTTRPADAGNTADVCWDGCQSGITVQGVTVRWLNHRTFEVKFRAPQAPWFEYSHGRLGVHPLVSGINHLGIECLVVASGCALLPADAEVPVLLNVALPDLCRPITTCATLTLSSSRAQIGDVIVVHGWAPIESVIGQPWGFSLDASGAIGQTSHPAIRYLPTKCACEHTAVIAPRYVSLEPSRTWSSLGTLNPVALSWAGYADANPVPASTDIVWCGGTGVGVQAGNSLTTLPTGDVATTLARTDLRFVGPQQADPPCATGIVDPSRPGTVYAGFATGVGGIIPPVETAAMFTRDGGSIWQLVPVPLGHNASEFGGFRLDGRTVEALFGAQDSAGSPGDVAVEATSNGGVTWSQKPLSCPSAGPCVIFGPAIQGNCAMDGSPQLFLVGTSGGPMGAWSTSSWVTTVNGCFSQELVATSAKRAFLLDPSSSYPILTTLDGGATWSHVSMPPIPGLEVGASASLDSQLVLAPDGSLLALVPTASYLSHRLYRLYPRATSWCQVHAKGLASEMSGYVQSLRTSGRLFVWTWSPTNRPTQVRHELAGLSKLTCTS